ncbi:hypothetical protein E3P92_01440 [Wallemia ichthyophaga]|uniref:Copper-fist domain-containing protein n=1 Tax=Wallemia ichthyophaga TaxID=245174 RepID=A0A4T0HPA4_WALIC|nr:hypothetical protein E3P90_01193 [Wallemia ichthyophaga]TIB16085.1 hypothetical protein E3P92_01440 [Wallemia ichthyophaga]TIB16562.1 hypothetical protein E3P93_00944 [Wallemia ichthyophaga]TIB24580.1 hypothetical protein E3P89_00898 [Wallemia ichthyophaga]TIB26487.1 hypothetical protein E3P88_01062 [Wallemia ichthyophaga]
MVSDISKRRILTNFPKPFINGVKLACATCIKGHRSSSCAHDDRPLFEVKRKGRPPAQCTKCKDQRKDGNSSSKCVCQDRQEPAPKSNCNGNGKDGPPPRKLKKGERAPLPPQAHYPNGLKDAYSSLLPPQAQKEGEPSMISLERLMNPCRCKVGGRCNCSEKKRAFVTNMLPSIADVIGHCSCGPSCACPGCLTHRNPPLPAQTETQAEATTYTPEESATCGCDEINVHELLKKSECGNLEEFLQKASSLVPFPPQGISSNIDSYVDGGTLGLQSWQQLYDPRNRGITRLPPLETECCGGSCQCQALGVECRCEESCCGCCTSCNCEAEANGNPSSSASASASTNTLTLPTQSNSLKLDIPKVDAPPSCCSKPAKSENNGQLSPTSLTAAISQPGGLKIPQQLVSPNVAANHWVSVVDAKKTECLTKQVQFPKYIPHDESDPTRTFIDFI